MDVTLIERARQRAGITQEALARQAGTSRPTLSAYEHGRKSPTLETAERIVRAAGFLLDLAEQITWFEVAGARGQIHHVPNRLFRLRLENAYAAFVAPAHLDWSAPNRQVELVDPQQRRRWYEVVLREGGRADIERFIDGALLIEAWPDIVLPRAIRQPWAEAVARSIGRAT